MKKNKWLLETVASAFVTSIVFTAVFMLAMYLLNKFLWHDPSGSPFWAAIVVFVMYTILQMFREVQARREREKQGRPLHEAE